VVVLRVRPFNLGYHGVRIAVYSLMEVARQRGRRNGGMESCRRTGQEIRKQAFLEHFSGKNDVEDDEEKRGWQAKRCAEFAQGREIFAQSV
jgi:hypothetical protein